jgi:hypothetical protein
MSPLYHKDRLQFNIQTSNTIHTEIIMVNEQRKSWFIRQTPPKSP